jgi:hypothetical protein
VDYRFRGNDGFSKKGEFLRDKQKMTQGGRVGKDIKEGRGRAGFQPALE